MLGACLQKLAHRFRHLTHLQSEKCIKCSYIVPTRTFSIEAELVRAANLMAEKLS